ncbi:MAG: YdeI/OmpD-associated family protein [Candidatus Micrarchaeota archaeon]|nr:YdeI/OmpD-associated family protein [Candidatus Micrarchaeota archaeon]
MRLGKTLYASGRKAWRAWLSKHHGKEKEIWLIYPKKRTGKPRIPYNDAVEEALCFGWIDSTVKSVDSGNFAQRFSPRRPGSGLSQMNRERIRKLVSGKKMTEAGLAAVSHALEPGSGGEKFTFPEDILGAIKKDGAAWKNFQQLPEPYKRIRVAYIDSRRRHGAEMFKKSLRHFIKMTAKNKRFGFVRE